MSKPQNQAAKVAAYCQSNLDLDNPNIGAEYNYTSLALALIDAVYSIGVTYQSTQNTVARFCQAVNIQPFADTVWPPPVKSQVDISSLLAVYKKHGARKMAEEVFQNRQRTSSTYGILKSEAVERLARLLSDQNIQTFQDMQTIMADPVKCVSLESSWKEVPGQTSGISWRYFRMLSGDSGEIKPDRMVLRFVGKALKTNLPVTPVNIAKANQLMHEATEILMSKYPSLTPRRLDYLVWSFERTEPLVPDKPKAGSRNR